MADAINLEQLLDAANFANSIQDRPVGLGLRVIEGLPANFHYVYSPKSDHVFADTTIAIYDNRMDASTLRVYMITREQIAEGLEDNTTLPLRTLLRYSGDEAVQYINQLIELRANPAP